MWISNLKNRHAVSLRRLFPSASFVGCGDIHVTSVSDNSKDCSPSCLFAAVPGTRVNGSEHIQEAIAFGAQAILCSQPHSEVSIPQCVVPHVRSAHSILCHEMFGNPSRKLKTVGITGTNGKTTTSYLVRSILQAAGFQTGLLGTIEYHDGVDGESSHLTTPDASTTAKYLQRMCELGTTHAVFEMSSHALDQSRNAGLELDVAAVTNITQDHLDYHASFECYLESKAKIFDYLREDGSVVLNHDDVYTRALRGHQAIRGNVLLHSSRQQQAIFAEAVDCTLSGSTFRLHSPAGEVAVHTPLIGRHNVDNCLTAAAICLSLGVERECIARGIEQLESVPGRLESIELGQGYGVFVDYAHTEDALTRSLETLKSLTARRVICVFGAGGDRDRSKRPLMGKAASKADCVVVTSDNPRTEDPDQIIEEIIAGIPNGRGNVDVISDRESAIRSAIHSALPGDAVLIAGKGHETYQIVGDEKHPFDDREVARNALKTIPLRMTA